MRGDTCHVGRSVPRMDHMDAMADPGTDRVDDNGGRETDKIDRALGAELRGWRNKRGKSQEELASIANMDKKTVGRLERGERPMTMTQLYKLCQALDVKPSQLIDAVEREIGID